MEEGDARMTCHTKGTQGRMRARIQGGNRKTKGGRELERCDIFTFRIFRSFFRKGHKKIFQFQEFVIYLNIEYINSYFF